MKMTKALLATGLSIVAVVATPGASAATYQFVVIDPSLTQNGAPFDDNSYTFFFDSAPTPTVFDTESFTLSGSATYTAGVFGAYRVDGPFKFYTGDAFGGLDTPLNIYLGDQLFTGTTAAPVFRLGTFQLDTGSITISAMATAVPEPATWAMMVFGFALAGTASKLALSRVSKQTLMRNARPSSPRRDGAVPRCRSCRSRAASSPTSPAQAPTRP